MPRLYGDAVPELGQHRDRLARPDVLARRRTRPSAARSSVGRVARDAVAPATTASASARASRRAGRSRTGTATAASRAGARPRGELAHDDDGQQRTASAHAGNSVLQHLRDASGRRSSSPAPSPKTPLHASMPVSRRSRVAAQRAHGRDADRRHVGEVDHRAAARAAVGSAASRSRRPRRAARSRRGSAEVRQRAGAHEQQQRHERERRPPARARLRARAGAAAVAASRPPSTRARRRWRRARRRRSRRC